MLVQDMRANSDRQPRLGSRSAGPFRKQRRVNASSSKIDDHPHSFSRIGDSLLNDNSFVSISLTYLPQLIYVDHAPEL